MVPRPRRRWRRSFSSPVLSSGESRNDRKVDSLGRGERWRIRGHGRARGGPAGLTGGVRARACAAPATCYEADGIVGGHREDGRVRRLPLRPRRPPLLHEARAGRSSCGRRCSATSSSRGPRLSRIYYDGKYFAYPLQARDVVARLGVVESALCALSYLWQPRTPAATRARDVRGLGHATFGARLYDSFFRTYTEKVWGIPGSEIRAEWAAQRIKNFSLFAGGADDPRPASART